MRLSLAMLERVQEDAQAYLAKIATRTLLDKYQDFAVA
jgi:hypothetical protein